MIENPQRGSAVGTIMNTKLYVDNLPAVFTENDLMDLFSSYGNIAEVYLRVNQGSGQSRTFGCINMATSEGARLAFQGLNGKAIGTFTLMVSESRPGRPGFVPAGQHRSPRRNASCLY